MNLAARVGSGPTLRTYRNQYGREPAVIRAAGEAPSPVMGLGITSPEVQPLPRQPRPPYWTFTAGMPRARESE